MAPDIALANSRVVRAPGGEGVEIVFADRAVRRFPVHVSESLGICIKLGAAHEVLVEGRRVSYPADSVSVRAPGCVWASEEGLHGFVSVDVSPALLPEDWTGGPMEFVGCGDLPDVRAAARGLSAATDAFEHDQLLAELLGAVFASSAMDSVSARDPVGPAGAVAAACEFLRVNVAGRPSLDAAAAAAGVSKFTLLRRFRRMLGTTPHAYLVMVRVSRAQTLLADGALPAEAAAAAGFADQAHLGLWFRRLLGVTPAAYRRQLRRPAISLQTSPS